MRIVYAMALMALGFVSSSPANAQLSINRLWVDIAAGATPRADLVVRNDSGERYYINVTTSEITNPGSPEEAPVQIADPQQLGLLVTPNRLILEPGASRSIRVVSLNQQLPKDRIYRVLVRPEVGSVTGPETADGQTGLAIKLLPAYDVLVVARATAPASQITSERRPDELILRNQGNTNVLVFDGRVCPAGVEQGDACRNIPARRLYAGNEFRVALTNPSEVVFVREQTSFASDPRDVRY